MADPAEVYYVDGSRNQQGPVPAGEIARLIRTGTIRRDTMVWYAGMVDWRPAREVNEFASLFVQAASPRSPAAPSPPAFPSAAPVRRPAPMAGPYPGQATHVEQFEPGSRMGLGRAIATCFRKYVDFTGRARRAEYWFWHLFYWLLLVVVVVLDVIMARLRAPPVFTVLALLALFLPTLAGTVRRLHDTDHSGWMIFIAWVPLAGPIIFLVFMCKRGTAGPNRFGLDPLGSDVAATFE